ncbi:uncharacterized protein LOC134846819 [Symsagittifera roscoffensis]|uniref:uncharacterized protein LOC134846819 n=1 Tax=Symsagittifera roscoffensis TaxID=84072 RepID=UPI00307B3E2F
MSMPLRPCSLNAALKVLAEQLGPSPTARVFGHREVQKVFEAIKTCSDNIAYNRIRIMGGDEQKTSCWATLDFDCVAFVNVDEQFWRSSTGLEQKLDDLQARVINSWKLSLARQLPGVVVSFPEDQKCKLEWIDYGFTADLLVGVNALTQKDRENLAASKGKSLADIQSERIMLAVANLSSNHTERKRIATKLIISASVMERSAYLMEQKSALHHEAARLAKFWVLMNASGKKKGASSLFSIIASNCDTNTILMDAFKKFLQSLNNWKTLSIDLSLDLNLPKQLEATKVIDPGNQFDNYFTNEDEPKRVKVFMNTLKNRSKKTINRMHSTKGNSNWAAIADFFLLDKYLRLDKRLFKTVIFEITISNNQSLFPRILAGTKGRKHRFIAQVFLLMKLAASFVPRRNNGGDYRDTVLIANDLKTLLTTRLSATFVSSISFEQKQNKTHMSFVLPVASEESSLVIDGFV